jgi:DNA-binding beta-propeller fold protein YncE
LLATTLKAIVLDTEDKSVSAIDASTGAVTTRVALSDTPRQLILAPDGKRIAVLSRGEGTESFWTSHFNPTSKSSLTMIDAASMKAIGRAELGWDIGRAVFSRDGATVTVLTPGVLSRKSNEVKPAELIRVDAKTARAVRVRE